MIKGLRRSGWQIKRRIKDKKNDEEDIVKYLFSNDNDNDNDESDESDKSDKSDESDDSNKSNNVVSFFILSPFF